MKIIEGINLGIRFILEMSSLAALGYWGYKTGSGATRWVLTFGAPAAAVVLWGLFVSEKPTIELARALQLVIEFIVFGAAVVALAAAGQGALAATFAIVALISGTLNYVWD